MNSVKPDGVMCPDFHVAASARFLGMASACGPPAVNDDSYDRAGE